MPKPEEKKTKSARKLKFNSKYFRVVITGLLLTAGAVFLILSSGSLFGKDCTSVYRNDRQVTINDRIFETEATRSNQELQKGLGGRDCIGDNQAMLFTFPAPGQHGIWMKDMRFPLDVLWVSADKKIVAIEKNFTPETYPEAAINEEDKPALYVLEVKSGTVDQLGIQLGTPVNF